MDVSGVVIDSDVDGEASSYSNGSAFDSKFISPTNKKSICSGMDGIKMSTQKTNPNPNPESRLVRDFNPQINNLKQSDNKKWIRKLAEFSYNLHLKNKMLPLLNYCYLPHHIIKLVYAFIY